MAAEEWATSKEPGTPATTGRSRLAAAAAAAALVIGPRPSPHARPCVSPLTQRLRLPVLRHQHAEGGGASRQAGRGASHYAGSCHRVFPWQPARQVSGRYSCVLSPSGSRWDERCVLKAACVPLKQLRREGGEQTPAAAALCGEEETLGQVGRRQTPPRGRSLSWEAPFNHLFTPSLPSD